MLAGDGEALQTLSDGSVWLRQGAFAAAASYPRAAALEHMKAISLSAASYAFTGGQVLMAASNGTGTIVTCANNQNGNISRSTDNGATWADVAVAGLAANIQGVWFLNGKFWLVSASANDLTIAESTTGATGTWTARYVSTAGVGTFTQGTISLEWTGTNYVIALGTTTAGLVVHTSPTGVTWTPRTFGAGTGTSIMYLAATSSSGTIVASIGAGATNYRVSTDHGVTWGSLVAYPSGSTGSYVFSVGSRFYCVLSDGSLWTATDPSATANWTQLPRPQLGQGLSPNQLGALYPYRTVARDAVYLLTAATGFVIRLDAAGSYTVRRTNRNTVLNATLGVFLVENGNTVTFLGTGSTAFARAACGWDTFNAVSMGSISSVASTPQNLYVRIA